MNSLIESYGGFPNTYSNNFTNFYNSNFSDWAKSLSPTDIAKLSNNANGLASSTNVAQDLGWATRTPDFSQGLYSSNVTNGSNLNNGSDLTWWGQNGGLIKDIGGAAMAAAGAVTAVGDMIRNNKTFKEQKKNFELQREIARENLAMQRAEYNRLKTNRANLSRAYGA